MTLPGLASCQEYEVSVMVRVGWASVACGEQCSLYRRHPASDSWTTEATQLQVPAESCSEYIYAVTITVEEEVNTEELPVMILEEEANGFELKTGEVNTMCEVSFDTGGHVQTMTTFVTIKLSTKHSVNYCPWCRHFSPFISCMRSISIPKVCRLYGVKCSLK